MKSRRAAPSSKDTRPRRTAVTRPSPIHRADGSPIRVLLISDEPVLASLVKMSLHDEGWIVQLARTGDDAIAALDRFGADVLVVDMPLCDIDVSHVLGRVRNADVYTPMLFLITEVAVKQRRAATTPGVDDYLVKPFSLEQLAATLRSLLHRSWQLPPDVETLTIGDLVIDGISRDVIWGGATVSLSRIEFELLRFLARNPGRVVSRDEILDRVWNYDAAIRAENVDGVIFCIRRKIGGGEHPVIHTVRGQGFMLGVPERAGALDKSGQQHQGVRSRPT